MDPDPAGQHRFTWELGPEISYPQYGLGIGGNVIAAFDNEGAAQFGVKTTAFRQFGLLGIDLGVGVFFTDSRKTGEFTLTAHTAIRLGNVAHATVSMDVIDRGARGSESRLYLGALLRRLDTSIPWPSVIVTVGSFVAVVVMRETISA